MIQLILNVKISKTTKITSYFANFEKKFNLFEISRNQISTKSTITKKITIKNIHDNIFKMQKRLMKHQNKKKKMTFLLKKKNKIYFHTKNLKINKKKAKSLIM